jgi:hypothetical protein
VFVKRTKEGSQEKKKRKLVIINKFDYCFTDYALLEG